MIRKLTQTFFVQMAFSFLGAVFLSPGQAFAGDISGSINLPDTIVYEDSLGSCKKRHCFWDEHNGIVSTQRIQRNVSNELRAVLVGRKFEDTPNTFELHLRGGGMEPATLVVGTGSTLRIINDDSFERKPFAKGMKGMPGSVLAPKAARTFKALETGAKTVSDRAIPNAKGFLHVLSKFAASAAVSKGGAFRFSDVRAGNYSLEVYFKNKQILKKKISVPHRGTLKLDDLTLSNNETGK